MDDDRKCPPLGMGSVDFNALHDADARGDDLAEAIAAATTRVEPPKPLTGKELLDELKSIAEAEGIVAEPDWHKDDYRAAIASKRNPPPAQPLTPPADEILAADGDDDAPVGGA